MSPKHPVKRAIMVLRAWLAMLIILMLVNAHVATAYLFSEIAKSIPFYVIAITAVVWFINVWDSRAVIVCCGLCVVGLFLRGFEVLIFGTHLTWNIRWTGATLWWFTGGTTFSLGVLNVVAISKKEAEAWVWQLRQPPS